MSSIGPAPSSNSSPSTMAPAAAGRLVRDSVGNVLQDGDHEIGFRIDGAGAMELKSEFVRKT